MNLVYDYPTWYLVLCVLLGLGYALLLYGKDRLLEEAGRWLKILLAVFRTVAVSIIAFLLLGPLIETSDEEREKPVIIVAQDDSGSLMMSRDSSYYKGDYLGALNDFVDRLGNDYQVNTYSFGSTVEEGLDVDFEARETDMSRMFEEIKTRFFNRNIGAVIVASDGIYNKGTDPSTRASSIRNTGIYTVAMGDTTARRDLYIERVEHNRLAYLGNDFPVEVIVRADKLKGQASTLTISKDGNVLSSQEVTIDRNRYEETVAFTVSATQQGLQRYRVSLTPVEDELTEANNSKDLFIDVLDSRQKVLILADAPHPDIRPIRYGIESNRNYEVEVALADDFSGNVDEYNLIILHQLPSVQHRMTVTLDAIINNEVPVMFIFGKKTDFGEFNRLALGLEVIGYRGGFDVVNPSLVGGFNLFTLSDELKQKSREFPPIYVPFGTYKTSGSINPLYMQKLGNLVKQDPLLMFNKHHNTKVAFLAGEGVWRWKLFAPEVFDELFTKTVQYMAAREDKSNFRVFSKNDFMENEPVIFEAEVYNESYELINDPKVSIVITNEEGKEFNYDFQTAGNAYRLDAGRFDVGTYTYTAEVNLNGKEYTSTGEFSVSPVKIEMTNLVANHQLMYNIANNNGGSMYYPDQLEQLYDDLMSRGDIVDIVYDKKRYDDVIRFQWIFFILIALLGVEWFLRKRSGGY